MEPLPSTQWKSYQDWNWGGMDVRLKHFLAGIHKPAIVTNKHVKISDPFAAGQYWCCLELVADDGTLFIARMRLPPHPEATGYLDDSLRIDCELATMNYVRSRTSIPVPKVFAYEKEGSAKAHIVGAPYMIIEGFRGTTLQDSIDLFDIPETAQQKVFDQWTSFQAELATLTFSHIGSVRSTSHADPKPSIVKIPTDEAGTIGPFLHSAEYFYSIASAKYQTALKTLDPSQKMPGRFDILGPYVFCDIISRASIFKSLLPGPFPLNHMDMGAQNLLVDNNFNIIAVIDWEMAQISPWEALYFPMPFPTNIESSSDLQEHLSDTNHVAHKFTTKIFEAQRVYVASFRRAESKLKELGTTVDHSLASLIESDASKLYWIMEQFGGGTADWDEIHMFAAVRIAFGMDRTAAENYFQTKAAEIKDQKAGTHIHSIGSSGTM